MVYPHYRGGGAKLIPHPGAKVIPHRGPGNSPPLAMKSMTANHSSYILSEAHYRTLERKDHGKEEHAYERDCRDYLSVASRKHQQGNQSLVRLGLENRPR